MCVVIALVLMASTVTSTTVESWIEDAVAGNTALPSLAAVQSAAEDTLVLGDDAEIEEWTSRLRWRGAVPKVDIRFGTDTDLSVRDALAGSASSWTNTGRGLGLDVVVKFGLGDLVFADLELRANRERIARSAAIRLVRERITELYFRRLDVWIAYRLEPSHELRLDAARLDGLIRALTGGRLDSYRKEPMP
ncbi:MAG: hypothetical protein RMA76_34315 [Deltaproteobacteria bacterium]